MIPEKFRTELDSYEFILASWVRFAVKTSSTFVMPNGLSIEDDGKLSLFHEVKDIDPAIKCRDGLIVRRLQLNFRDSANRTVH